MKILKTLFFGIIFILMLSYYYVYEVRQFKENQQQKEEARRIFPSLTKEDIQTFTIQGGKGTATLAWKNDAWKMTSPVKAPGDQKAVKTLVEALLNLKRDTIISEQPENYKDFGLASPSLKINLSTKEGEKSLWIGDKNPTGSLIYGRIGSRPRIFSLASHEKRTFNKGPYDLRDKTILRLREDRVKRLSLVRDTKQMEIERNGKAWQIIRPFNWRADTNKIEAVLSSITDSKIRKFVSEKPKNLEKFGLARPTAIERFFVDEGGREVERTLRIGGKQRDQKRYYAKREATGNVFLIGEDILKKIPENLADFRDRKLFTFQTGDIFKIRSSGKETIIVQKNETGDWRMLGPKKTKADPFEVNQWTDRITKTKIRNFLDDHSNQGPKFGLSAPSLTLEIWGKEAKHSQKIMVGGEVPGGKARYAALSGHPTILTISNEAYKGLLRTSAGLRNRKLLSFDTEEIQKIEIAMGRRRAHLEKSAGKWKVMPSGKTLEGDEVRGILWDMTDLSFTKVVAEGDLTLKTFALDTPVLSIRLKKEKDQDAGEIRFGGRVPIENVKGKKQETPHYYAVNESLKEVFEVRTDLVKKIGAKFKDWGIRP